MLRGINKLTGAWRLPDGRVTVDFAPNKSRTTFNKGEAYYDGRRLKRPVMVYYDNGSRAVMSDTAADVLMLDAGYRAYGNAQESWDFV